MKLNGFRQINILTARGSWGKKKTNPVVLVNILKHTQMLAIKSLSPRPSFINISFIKTCHFKKEEF